MKRIILQLCVDAGFTLSSSDGERGGWVGSRCMVRGHRQSVIARFVILLLLSWLVTEHSAFAHPVSQNSLVVEIFPDKITFHMRVTTEEVFVSSALGATGDDKGVPFTDVWKKHAQYLLKHFKVSADGQLLSGRLVNLIEPGSSARKLGDTTFRETDYANRTPEPTPRPSQEGSTAPGIDPLLGGVRGGPVGGRFIEKGQPENDVSSPRPSPPLRSGEGETSTDRVIYDFEFATTAVPQKVRIQQDVLREFNYAPGNPWEATYVVRIGQHERQSTEGLLLTFKEPLDYICDWKADTAGHQSRAPRLEKWRMIKDYLRHGIMHILSGYDHLLFIGALVLATVTLWDLVKVVTAFTLAHTITLTLAVLDLVRLPSSVVEPMIAASIVFVALQNVFWPERTRGWSRLAVAFFFGLFHGLGFAGGLLSAMEGMAGLTVGLAIVAFSVGVEVGHQIVVLPVFCALKLARATQVDETGRNQIAARALRYGSAAISVAGIFYLVAALR
ncbi:MAG: HupE/UreJ family protein [Verrucomicrobia bacterium]|nr:HupE/UreJ family protein [Verrucomicrobiota bacterium]